MFVRIATVIVNYIYLYDLHIRTLVILFCQTEIVLKDSTAFVYVTKSKKSNLTFYYRIAIYLGVFQFHNMLQSHWQVRLCFSSALRYEKSKILDGRSYIVYLNTMTKTNAFLN